MPPVYTTAMTEDEWPMSAGEMFQLGRRVLDGASFSWLAERTEWSEEEIEIAWEYCKGCLSQHLMEAASPELTDDQVHENSEQCLRLLLDWKEKLELTVSFDIDAAEPPND